MRAPAACLDFRLIPLRPIWPQGRLPRKVCTLDSLPADYFGHENQESSGW